MQVKLSASWVRYAYLVRSILIVFVVGAFLSSCDSGCINDVFGPANAMRVNAARAHGPHPNATLGPLSSMPSLLFNGNVTTIIPAFGSTLQNVNGEGLARQSDCSLTEYFLENYNPAASTFLVAATVPNYGNYLHTNARLTTSSNHFPNGCTDTTQGIASHNVVFLGTTSNGASIAAGVDYNGMLHAGTISLAGGTYSQTVLSIPGPNSLAAADVNGDGKIDLIVAASGSGTTSQGAGVYVLLSNGDGTFANPVSYAAMSQPAALTVDDVNGDGKLDLVVVGIDTTSGGTSGLEVLLGNGNGTFSAATPSGGVNKITSVATGDFNGDGKKDLVLGNGQILLGHGDGTFAAPSFTLPVAAYNSGFPGVPVVGDFNNDGKLDIALNIGAVNLLSVFLGKGDGTFTPGASYADIYNSYNLSASDLDGDGNLDLIVGISNSGIYGPDENTGGDIQFLMGNGDGTFQSAPAFPNTVSQAGGGAPEFAVGDFNGDGKPDLLGVAQGGTPALVFLQGDGAGNFAAAKTSPEAQPSLLAAGDMNGDGKLDAVYADKQAGSVAVAFGHGDGTFAAGTDYAVPNSTTVIDLVVADVNGDGKPDVLITAGNRTTTPVSATGLYLYLNKGDGTLLPPTTLDTPGSPGLLAVGDVNGDGKQDLVLVDSAVGGGTPQGSLLVYLGNGDGTFAAASSIPAGYSITGLAIADVNKDGKPDLVFANADQQLTQNSLNVLPGNGNGTFGAAVTSSVQFTGATNLAVADFDGDGNPDVLIGQCCGLAFTSISLGKGDGTFPVNLAIAPAVSSSYVVAADVNGDKRPDIVTASGNALEVFTNLYGAGLVTLTPTTTSLTISPNPASTGQTVTFTAQVTENPGSAIPTGTVTFLNGATALGSGTLGSSGAATFTSSTLAPGSYTVTAQYGGDSSNAPSTSAVVTLTITAGPAPVATTTTLTATPATATAGAQVALTATVKANSGTGTPTGSVTFLDGTATLGTATLDSTGSGTYNTSSLAVGAHSITAAYAGDTNDLASTSPAVTVTIQQSPPTFSLSASPSSGSVSGSGSVTSTVSITPANGFNQAVALTCSGAPTNATCSLSPASVTPSGTAASTSTLTIQTGVATAMSTTRSAGASFMALLFSGGVFGLCFARRRNMLRQRIQLLCVLALSLAAGIALGCGGGGHSTPAGASQITVTATSGQLTQTTTFSLTVQ